MTKIDMTARITHFRNLIVALPALSRRVLEAVDKRLYAEAGYSDVTVKEVAGDLKIKDSQVKGALSHLSTVRLVNLDPNPNTRETLIYPTYWSGKEYGGLGGLHLPEIMESKVEQPTDALETVPHNVVVPEADSSPVIKEKKMTGKAKTVKKAQPAASTPEKLDAAVLKAIDYLSDKLDKNVISLVELAEHMGVASTVALGESLERQTKAGKIEGSQTKGYSLTPSGEEANIDADEELTPSEAGEKPKKAPKPKAAKAEKAPKAPKAPKEKKVKEEAPPTAEELAEIEKYKERYASRGHNLETHTKNGQKSSISLLGRVRMAMAAAARWQDSDKKAQLIKDMNKRNGGVQKPKPTPRAPKAEKPAKEPKPSKEKKVKAPKREAAPEVPAEDVPATETNDTTVAE